MAKNKEAEPNTEKQGESAGSKILTLIIIMLIVFIWLAILALLIKFDVGGIGTNTFRPVLKDVPVLNMILPDVSDETIARENQYPYKNLSEAVDYIKYLEEKVDKLTEENDDYASRQASLQTELESLRHFEEEYEQYLKLRELFDREVVYNDKAPEAAEYLKWYEAMYPENAATIYAELTEASQVDEIYATIAARMAKMKAKDAAAILMEYTSDLDFIVRVLDCLKVKQISDILTEMSKSNSLFAAQVVNRMKDMGYEGLAD